MKIVKIEQRGRWRDAADAARTTVHMEPGTREPSNNWKRALLLSEHSPIRQLSISAKWVDLPYWVSVHLVRHKIGIEHWVRTQRADRTGEDRNKLPQCAPVEHEILATYQAIISISRKRLCNQAAPETTAAWELLISAIKRVDPVLAGVCVPECCYRGFCPEAKTCGFASSEFFTDQIAKYREGVKT